MEKSSNQENKGNRFWTGFWTGIVAADIFLFVGICILSTLHSHEAKIWRIKVLAKPIVMSSVQKHELHEALVARGMYEADIEPEIKNSKLNAWIKNLKGTKSLEYFPIFPQTFTIKILQKWTIKKFFYRPKGKQRMINSSENL